MSEQQPQIEEDHTSGIYQHITTALEKARAAIEEARKRVLEFDSRFNASEKASSYLSNAVLQAQTSLAELQQTAHTLKGAAAEIPVKAFTNGIAKANLALSNLVEVAKNYDETHHLTSSLSAVVNPHKEQAHTAILLVAEKATEAAHYSTTKLLGVSDGLRELLLNAADTGINQAAKADEKFKITESSSVVGSKIKTTAKELDERFGLSLYIGAAVGSAQSLDQRLAGGRVSPAILSAYNIGLSMVGYVHEKFEEKKKAIHDAQQPTTTTSSS